MSQTNGTKVGPDSSPTDVGEVCYLVDDDPSVRKSISRLLESEGFKVCAFAEPETFLNHLATNPVRLVCPGYLDGKNVGDGITRTPVCEIARNSRDFYYGS
jgi:PleD family two-component response regulator